MKNFVAVLLAVIALTSCTKQNILPSQPSKSTSVETNLLNTTLQSSVVFRQSVPKTVYLSPGLNTLQTDSFSVNGETAYVTRFVFTLNGSLDLSAFKFYINGGQVRSTITNSNGVIIVAMRRTTPLIPGNYNYILQAKTRGNAGTSFSISLNSVIIVDANNYNADVQNLPQSGNNFLLN